MSRDIACIEISLVLGLVDCLYRDIAYNEVSFVLRHRLYIYRLLVSRDCLYREVSLVLEITFIERSLVS